VLPSARSPLLEKLPPLFWSSGSSPKMAFSTYVPLRRVSPLFKPFFFPAFSNSAVHGTHIVWPEQAFLVDLTQVDEAFGLSRGWPRPRLTLARPPVAPCLRRRRRRSSLFPTAPPCRGADDRRLTERTPSFFRELV